MSSKAITEKPESEVLGARPLVAEVAPSVIRSDVPTAARWIGLIGLGLFVLGSVAVGFDQAGSPRYIGGGWGSLFALLGLCGLIYHAARDSEKQFRRLYLALGILLWGFASVWAYYPVEVSTVLGQSEQRIGAHFLARGFPALFVALLFLLPAVRNETEPSWHRGAVFAIGALGAVLAGLGLVWGCISTSFFLPTGLLLALLGLGYLWAFIGFHGAESDVGYRTCAGLGAAGVLVLLAGLVRSLLTRYGLFGVAIDLSYLTSAGILVIGVGLLYSVIALVLSSDWPTVVLMRRELASFFYSPMVYLVIAGCAVIAFFSYWIFVSRVIRMTAVRQPLVEPIIHSYVLDWPPVFFFIIAVPFLTMGLFSSERRAGTLEMLLTAPVRDTPVVLSKFFAVLLIFMLTWTPFGLYLIALRVVGGQPFDYRPIISFFIGLVFSGAGALAMGLFFSSLTQHQLIAFVLTGMMMILWTFAHVIQGFILQGTGAWADILHHYSYIELWDTTLNGRVALGDLTVHAAVTVFWLFLTVKFLEARKWW
jgi:ABC-2 type transport system permease protein